MCDTTSGSGSPFSHDDIRKLFAMMKTVDDVEAAAKSQADKIEQLMQWGASIPHTEKQVADHNTQLNGLGERLTKQDKEQTDKLNGLRHGLEKQITEVRINDIGRLNSFEHTARTIGIIILSVLGAEIVGHFLRKFW